MKKSKLNLLVASKDFLQKRKVINNSIIQISKEMKITWGLIALIIEHYAKQKTDRDKEMIQKRKNFQTNVPPKTESECNFQLKRKSEVKWNDILEQ